MARVHSRWQVTITGQGAQSYELVAKRPTDVVKAVAELGAPDKVLRLIRDNGLPRRINWTGQYSRIVAVRIAN